VERALFIAKKKNLKYLNADYQRVYFGNEFCERLLPGAEALSAIRWEIADRGLLFTLVTPYVTETGIQKIARLLETLPAGSEVVFNDWGVLRIIRQNFPALQPIQGRLLTKLKRGPRIAQFLDTLPPDALHHLRSTNLSVPAYQQFLKKQTIKRVELDNPLQGLNLEGVPEDLQLSLYIPFAYVSTTRFCLVANCDIPEKKGMIGIFPCHQECQKYTFYLNNPVMTTLLIRKGNTLFFKNMKLPPDIKETPIDRIVIQPEIPM
jgi:hypothetical protein